MFAFLSPGHVGVVSDPCVAEQVGQPLWHQDPDLFNRAPQLQDANIQTRLCPLNTVPVEGQFLLDKEKQEHQQLFYLLAYSLCLLQSKPCLLVVVQFYVGDSLGRICRI